MSSRNITVAQIAALEGVNYVTALKWVTEGKIPAFRINDRTAWQITPEDYRTWKKLREVLPSGKP